MSTKPASVANGYRHTWERPDVNSPLTGNRERDSRERPALRTQWPITESSCRSVESWKFEVGHAGLPALAPVQVLSVQLRG